MPTVGPIRETNVPVIFDSDSHGFGGPVNMDGPPVGSIAYSEPGDNLKVQLKIDYGYPSVTYQVFLVSGPSHALGTGYIAIGALTTNAAGAGSGTLMVAHATLQGAPFGAGYRNDHIDILHAAGDLSKGALTSGAINYFVCTVKEAMVPEIAKIEVYKGPSGPGDPHGPHVKG